MFIRQSYQEPKMLFLFDHSIFNNNMTKNKWEVDIYIDKNLYYLKHKGYYKYTLAIMYNILPITKSFQIHIPMNI